MQIPAIPDDLSEVDQWVLWRYEARDGKPTKVPYSAKLRRAKSTCVEDWSTFDEVCAVWQKCPQRFAGVGFVFHPDDPFAGIDLDDCLDNEQLVKEWARGVVERFSDTYCEVSPSGTGLKIWARGKLPSAVEAHVKDGAIEMYDRARYFTVTGKRYRGAPLQIEDHAADLLSLHARLSGRDRGPGSAWPVQPLPSGKIPAGQQHNTLVSIAGTLRARLVCDEAIRACLTAIGRYQCDPPADPAAIDRIVISTRHWSGRAQRRPASGR